jgi:hypothetical protein
VSVETLPSGKLVLTNTIVDNQLSEGMYACSASVSTDGQEAAYGLDLHVEPFLTRLVLPPTAGYEEYVDAVTRASDSWPALSFIVSPPTDGTDSLDYLIVRSTDINDTIYDSRIPNKEILPYFYGKTTPVAHWYVKRPETAGLCTTYVHAWTHGGKQSMDMIVVRVLDENGN